MSFRMSDDDPPWQDAETLERLYWDERMSQDEIAEELGCSRRTVYVWMDKYGIDTRTGYWRKPFEERFWDKVDKGDSDECWEWQAKRTWYGYGHVKKDGMMQNAHRVALELEEGDIGDLHACHTCDNPPCVNPNHLYAGTRSDNVNDSWERGDRDVSGENNPNAELTWEDVKEIRARRDSDTAAELAEEFDTKPTNIYNIWSGESWSETEAEQ